MNLQRSLTVVGSIYKYYAGYFQLSGVCFICMMFRRLDPFPSSGVKGERKDPTSFVLLTNWWTLWQLNPKIRHYQTGCSGGNASGLYSGDAHLNLTWYTSYLTGDFCGHNHFFPDVLQFIIHLSSRYSMLHSLRYWKHCKITHENRDITVMP
jgi:hypothetical protein